MEGAKQQETKKPESIGLLGCYYPLLVFVDICIVARTSFNETLKNWYDVTSKLLYNFSKMHVYFIISTAYKTERDVCKNLQ